MAPVLGLTYRPRERKTTERILSSVATGVAYGACLGLATNPSIYSSYGYNPASTLATNLIASSAVTMAYNSGYGYSPFRYGGLGILSGGFGGLLANCSVTPTNFTSSFYTDLDGSYNGVSSVSPLVNSAINNPFSFSGALGACMIGGYI